MSDETLKPCPFCGEEGGVTSRPGEWSVFCLYCPCELVAFFDTEAEAVAAWNRRADDGPAGGGG